jgi:hypothetical protein
MNTLLLGFPSVGFQWLVAFAVLPLSCFCHTSWCCYTSLFGGMAMGCCGERNQDDKVLAGYKDDTVNLTLPEQSN